MSKSKNKPKPVRPEWLDELSEGIEVTDAPISVTWQPRAPAPLVEETARVTAALGTNGTTAFCVLAAHLLSARLHRIGWKHVVQLGQMEYDDDEGKAATVTHMIVVSGKWGADATRGQFGDEGPIVFKLSSEKKFHPMAMERDGKRVFPANIEPTDEEVVDVMYHHRDRFDEDEVPQVLEFAGLADLIEPYRARERQGD